jgi:hypothetical protein
MILDKIRTLPIGYSEVLFQHKKYGITRTDFNNGDSIKIYAEELGGKDFISLNYYITRSSQSLKPCEMSKEKVIHFIKNIKLL